VDLSEYRMKETGSCTRSWLLTLARYYRIVQKSRWCWNLSHLLSLSATFAFHTGLFAEFEFPTYCAMHHLHPIPEPGPVEAISFVILTGRLRPFMWFAAFRSPKACCSLAAFRCSPLLGILHPCCMRMRHPLKSERSLGLGVPCKVPRAHVGCYKVGARGIQVCMRAHDTHQHQSNTRCSAVWTPWYIHACNMGFGEGVNWILHGTWACPKHPCYFPSTMKKKPTGLHLTWPCLLKYDMPCIKQSITCALKLNSTHVV
jgi:hypothetical protein